MTGILEKKMGDDVFRAEIGPEGGWTTTPKSESFEECFKPKRDDWAGEPWVVAFWNAVDTMDAEVVQEPEVEDDDGPKKHSDTPESTYVGQDAVAGGATNKVMSDKITGGLADDKTDSDFDPQALAKGVKVELEHTSDESIAREIARDHLTEDPRYYDKLEKMEAEPEKMSDGSQREEYSTTQLQVPHALSKLLTKLCGLIDQSDLTDKGIEEDHHVTVLYGINDDDSDGVRELMRSVSPVRIFINRASVFKKPGCDVLKINVDSGQLAKMHTDFKAALPHTNLHDSYVPHITLAYLKPGMGEKYANSEEFTTALSDLIGEPVKMTKLVFSDRDRHRTEFSVGDSLAKFTEDYHGPRPPGDPSEWQQLPEGPRHGKRWRKVEKQKTAKPKAQAPKAPGKSYDSQISKAREEAKQRKKDKQGKIRPKAQDRRHPVSKTPKPSKPLSEKAKRAMDSAFLCNATTTRYADHQEVKLAAALGGMSFPDSEPVDIVVGEKGKMDHGIELKTMVKNGNGKLTMDSYAQVRKINWEIANKTPFHTVVLDNQKVYHANGGHESGLMPGDAGYDKLHNDKERVIYYRRGVAGSARVHTMYKCKNVAELQKMMEMKEEDLPTEAQRTDDHLRVGKWEPFEDKIGRGFVNKKLGKVVRKKEKKAR